MTTNFNRLKEGIIRLTSIGKLQDEWKRTNYEITELEKQFAKFKEFNKAFPGEKVDEDVFTTSINITKMKLNDLNIQLKNLINSGDNSCMIFLNDNSRFIVNFDTITYLMEHQFIDDDLYNRMINEETNQDCMQPTGNKLIPYFIIMQRFKTNIVIKDVCSTETEIIRINKYLLPENIFKMLLDEYYCLTTSVKYDNISLVYNVATPTNYIMKLFLDELDRLKDRDTFLNYMFVVNTICQPSENIICEPIEQQSSSSSNSWQHLTSTNVRKNIFGWILEPSNHSKRVFIFFKIIKGVLYTFNTQLDKLTRYKYTYSIDDTRFSITYTEKKMNKKTNVETGYEEEYEETYIIPVVTIMDGKISLDNIPDFDDKTLQNDKITEDNRKYNKNITHTISRIQIYEINGQLDHQRYIDIQPQVFALVQEFKLSEETMKDILHNVTHLEKESIQMDCTLPNSCPIHNPYFCPKNSAFRNNIEKTFFGDEKITSSKGNNSPCVPDMALCNLPYEAAELSLINQYRENKKVAPRNYFSKPKYCKIDTYLGNKQMSSLEGGSVHSYKKRN
jgi:hypothetical protein